jgi:hypothetical protein
LRPALRERRIAAILADATLPGIGGTPGSAGRIRRRRQDRIDCKSEQSKTNHAHDCSPLCRIPYRQYKLITVPPPRGMNPTFRRTTRKDLAKLIACFG